MKLIPKGSNKISKVEKSLQITNKLIKEIDSREVTLADDFRCTIPDENFQKVLIEDYNIEVVDGTVAYKDVKGIDELRCAAKSIQSLEGIEYFISLERLICFANPISIMDIRKNSKLKTLICWQNYWNENKLNSLDVSNNPELEYLNVSPNDLTFLDLSNNPALTTLSCSRNQLTSLDVSNNPALEILSCSENQLTSLDVSKNTVLAKLICEENQLTSLDVSNNPKLKQVRLEGNPGNWWKELEKDEE